MFPSDGRAALSPRRLAQQDVQTVKIQSSICFFGTLIASARPEMLASPPPPSKNGLVLLIVRGCCMKASRFKSGFVEARLSWVLAGHVLLPAVWRPTATNLPRVFSAWTLGMIHHPHFFNLSLKIQTRFKATSHFRCFAVCCCFHLELAPRDSWKDNSVFSEGGNEAQRLRRH